MPLIFCRDLGVRYTTRIGARACASGIVSCWGETWFDAYGGFGDSAAKGALFSDEGSLSSVQFAPRFGPRVRAS
jgi:hypothetical protein